MNAREKLAPHLDELDATARHNLLARATHRSKREVEELVAELAARPDVPTSIRKLPARPGTPAVAATRLPQTQQGEPAREPLLSSKVDPATRAGVPEHPTQANPAPVAGPRPEPARMEPLAPARYKITFTAGTELREKLERLRALVPGADLAALIEDAVTEKLERVEARRFGKTRTPRKNAAACDTSAGSRYIPAPVKRVVFDRDGGRCTFVSVTGRRCRERHGLEFHHDRPFGLGGDRSPANIRLLCRTHNGFLAESTYGKEAMER